MPISFVGASDLGNNGGTTNTLSTSYTVGSGSNRLLAVGLIGDSFGGSDDITSVTYNGVSMTLAAKHTTGGERNTYLYYLLNPASGSNTVAITSTNTHYLLAGAADYDGVRQSGQPDATAESNDSGVNDSYASSITTVANNSWAICLNESFGNSAVAAGAGATLRTQGAAFKDWGLFDSGGPITPAGSYSMTTIMTGAGHAQIHVIASFSPAADIIMPGQILM
jgi:hypothetical protein